MFPTYSLPAWMKELVGVEELEAVIGGELIHQLGVGYTGRVPYRTGAPDGDHVILGLDARPGYLAVLEHLEGNDNPRRDRPRRVPAGRSGFRRRCPVGPRCRRGRRA